MTTAITLSPEVQAQDDKLVALAHALCADLTTMLKLSRQVHAGLRVIATGPERQWRNCWDSCTAVSETWNVLADQRDACIARITDHGKRIPVRHIDVWSNLA